MKKWLILGVVTAGLVTLGTANRAEASHGRSFGGCYGGGYGGGYGYGYSRSYYPSYGYGFSSYRSLPIYGSRYYGGGHHHHHHHHGHSHGGFFYNGRGFSIGFYR